jgi:tRNA(fMet)-specific endonuclease VapC
MSQIFLDTDACIEVIRGNPKPVEAFPGRRFLISSITRFEIRSGLRKRRSRKLENRAKEFLQNIESMPFDDAAADAAAIVRIALENRGEPIGAYDTLIAGHALSLHLPLLTGNQDEFNRVDGLEVLAWR